MMLQIARGEEAVSDPVLGAGRGKRVDDCVIYTTNGKGERRDGDALSRILRTITTRRNTSSQSL
jgi:hypothetical protein